MIQAAVFVHCPAKQSRRKKKVVRGWTKKNWLERDLTQDPPDYRADVLRKSIWSDFRLNEDKYTRAKFEPTDKVAVSISLSENWTTEGSLCIKIN